MSDEKSTLKLALELEATASKIVDRANALWDAADRVSDDIIRNQPMRSILGELSDLHALCKQLATQAGELAALEPRAGLNADLADLAARFACPLTDVCKDCVGRGCSTCHWVCVRSGAGKRFSAGEGES